MTFAGLLADWLSSPAGRLTELACWFLAAYLLGAIPFGLLLGWCIAGVDIRQHGSGNIGATNLARVIGWRYFPLALLLDFAKGAIPVSAWLWRTGHLQAVFRSTAVASPGLLEPLPLHELDCAALIGLAALSGHLWPIYLRFRGGKGVATGAGVVSVLMPMPTLLAALVWVIVAWMTRYVSLSSLTAAVMLVIGQLLHTWPDCFAPPHRAASCLALIGAGIVFVRHRENIARLWQGRESKIGQQVSVTPAAKMQADGLHGEQDQPGHTPTTGESPP
jgi:glycerol-3-phosphate acyltransferase PlsY